MAVKRVARDLKKLYKRSDIIGPLGKFMVKIGPKTALITSLLSAGGYMSGKIDDKTAAMLPVLLGGGLYAGGWALKLAPSIGLLRKSRSVQGNEGNLLENYLKAHSLAYLAELGERVFRYESRLRYTLDDIAVQREFISQQKFGIREDIAGWPMERLGFLGVLDRGGAVDPESLDGLVDWMCYYKPISDQIEKTEEGFVMSSMYALLHFMPQLVQTGLIGYDLSSLEDLQDGALLDRSGNKLEQQYLAKKVLRDVKKECGIGLGDLVVEMPERMWAKTWNFLVLRGIDGVVAEAMADFNREYNTDIFNAELFMYPGSEDARALTDEKFTGVRKSILERRKNDYRRLFGETFEEAVDILDRMLMHLVKNAVKVRSKYDFSYGTDIITSGSRFHANWMPNYNAVSDLESMDRPERYIDEYRDELRDRTKSRDLFLRYLQEYKPGIFQFENAEKLRAVLGAFHLDKWGSRTRFTKDMNDVSPMETNVADLIGRSEGYVDIHNKRLYAIRIYQELTSIWRREYIKIIETLAYSKPIEN